MLQEEKGYHYEAQSALDAARQSAGRLPQLGDPDLGRLWNDLLIARALIEEATTRVETDPTGNNEESATP
jgi:hypothetical protein